MRRAPAKPVRACTLRNWCLVSHVTFEAPLHTSHLTVFTLHTTHFTLHSSHCTLRTSQSTLFTLHTAPFAAPAAPAAQTKYLSSPAAATLHGKTQGFVLQLPPHNIAHATFRQPLHCVSQHPVANLHLSTDVATPNDNNHAAIPMRSATTASRNA